MVSPFSTQMVQSSVVEWFGIHTAPEYLEIGPVIKIFTIALVLNDILDSL